MRKIKLLTFTLIIFGSLFFLFGPEVLPENVQFEKLLNSASQSDVIIIFNSGGWGNTPLEKSDDFAPIIKGIEKTLNEWGLNAIVIPYERTEDGFLGKITGAKEIIKSLPEPSEKLAKEIKKFLEENPGKKVIMAGLSNGAAFVDKTIRQLNEFQNSVLAIEVGVPFWEQTFNSENILSLNNEGKDSFSKGEMKTLLFTLLKTPLNWMEAKISGQNLPFARAFQAPGHDYSWSSPEVGPKIVNFLAGKIH